jgi:uncharacterized glyoxalase superfamily protein PhnB
MAKKTKQKKAARAKRPAAKASRKLSPVPKGLGTVTVNLTLRDCARAIEFYKQAFDAKEVSPPAIAPDGKSIWHAALQIGNSVIFLNDPMTGDPWKEPSGSLWVYGPDVDGRFTRAISAGCRQTMPVEDMFWGDRTGTLVDPFGQTWTLGTHIKDMTPAQMKQAGDEFAAKMAAQASSQMPGQPSQPQASA